MKLSISFVLVLFFQVTTCQNILTVLAQQNGIAQFTDILTQNEDLVDCLNAGIHTLLVPNDVAIAQAKALTPHIFADNTSLRALLEYHILRATHPLATFTNTSQLVTTLLTNTSHTNVTGGQRVELLLKNGQPTFLSAVKAESEIAHSDVSYIGGLVHILDSVLQIPVSFPDTIRKAKLSSLTALLNKGNWLSPNSIAYRLALETPDLTFFGPNDPAYGASFAGWDGLSQARLDEIFVYHVLDKVAYSTDLKNNTQHATLADISLMARDYSASPGQLVTFVDQAQMIVSNYITANGVLHVLDRVLDPRQAGSAPSNAQVRAALGLPAVSAKRGLATPAIVGLIIGILAVLVACSLIFALRRRIKRKRSQRTSVIDGVSTYRQMLPDYNSSQDAHRSQAISAGSLRANTTLPRSPQSEPRILASITRAMFPSSPPVPNIIELAFKDWQVNNNEIDSSEHSSAQRRSTVGGSNGGAASEGGNVRITDAKDHH